MRIKNRDNPDRLAKRAYAKQFSRKVTGSGYINKAI